VYLVHWGEIRDSVGQYVCHTSWHGGGAGGDPQVTPRQLAGRRGEGDEAEQVNGYGPLGSFGVEMPTEMGGRMGGGSEMAPYVTSHGGGGGGEDDGFYACG